jgi:hypothetical protein
MSEDDVDQNELRRTGGADNDVFSTDFISKMHPNFRSPVPIPVQTEFEWRKHK